MNARSDPTDLPLIQTPVRLGGHMCKVLFVVVSLLFSLSAQSQQPAPSPTKTSEASKQRSDQPNNDTSVKKEFSKKTPSPVAHVKSAEENSIGKRQANEQKQDAPIDWWVKAATIGNAIFAFFLMISTIGLWIVTTRAANAADLSARAAIGIELPVLRPKAGDLLDIEEPIPEDAPYGCGEVDIVPRGQYCGIGYIEYHNFGRTPAFPVILETGWAVAATLPEKPAYQKSTAVSHAAVTGGSEFSVHAGHTIELTDAQKSAMREQTAYLWFYGKLTYDDFMNISRSAKFCWRFAKRNVADSSAYFASDGSLPKAYIR
jgi:hypothetical protein